MRAGDGFIGDAHRTRLHQVARLLGIGCEVQIGIEDLAFAQHRALDRLRLLDLHDHFAGRENFFGAVDDLGARLDIEAVVRADAFARAGLDQHAVTVRHQFAGALGRQADAIFVILDFLGGADDHPVSPICGAGRAQFRLSEAFGQT